jgi:hypothetical protein
MDDVRIKVIKSSDKQSNLRAVKTRWLPLH